MHAKFFGKRKKFFEKTVPDPWVISRPTPAVRADGPRGAIEPPVVAASKAPERARSCTTSAPRATSKSLAGRAWSDTDRRRPNDFFPVQRRAGANTDAPPRAAGVCPAARNFSAPLRWIPTFRMFRIKLHVTHYLCKSFPPASHLMRIICPTRHSSCTSSLCSSPDREEYVGRYST